MVRPLPAAIEAAIENAKARLHAKFGPRFHGMFLFGSYATGCATQESDVDLCVLIESLTWSDHREAMSAVIDASMETNIWLSPVVIDSDKFKARLEIEDPFIEEIALRGRQL